MLPTNEQLGRIITVARKIWRTFTEEEKANFYNETGTYGFVQMVADMLYIDIGELPFAQFDAMHSMIIRVRGGKY